MRQVNEAEMVWNVKYALRRLSRRHLKLCTLNNDFPDIM